MNSENSQFENTPSRSVYEYKFDNKIPVLFMMVGLPGSGKSYVASELSVNRDGNISKPIIFSSDSIREELYGDESCQGDANQVFVELHRRLKTSLSNGNDVIYDATNINKKRRIAFLRELKNISCYTVCVLCATPFEICVYANNNRDRVVPYHVIKRMYMSFTPPHKTEGFNDLFIIYNFAETYNYNLEKEYDIYKLFYGRNGLIYLDQENSHHTMTIGNHCMAASTYLIEQYKDANSKLIMAALLHDIGKAFVKSNVNAKGDRVDQEYHFYNHQNVGAYDSFFYTYEAFSDISVEDSLYIANLIYYHMHPYMAWRQSEKAKERDRQLLGDDMFNDIMLLHEADENAH